MNETAKEKALAQARSLGKRTEAARDLIAPRSLVGAPAYKRAVYVVVLLARRQNSVAPLSAAEKGPTALAPVPGVSRTSISPPL
jgi:hypothetical protein